MDVLNRDGTNPTKYCLKTIPDTAIAFNQLTNASGDCPFIEGTKYERFIEFNIVTGAGADHVDLTSTVQWQEGDQTFETVLENSLYDWD